MTNETDKNKEIKDLEKEVERAWDVARLTGQAILVAGILGSLVSYHSGLDAAKQEDSELVQRVLYEPIGNGGAIPAWYKHEPTGSRKEMLDRLDKVQYAIRNGYAKRE